MRPWTALMDYSGSFELPMLQWGHGLAAVDGRQGAAAAPH